MKKIFLAVLVLGCLSAQTLFAADDQRKGFSFYSKSQKQAEKVQVKAEEEVAKQAVEAVKVEATVVEEAPIVNETVAEAALAPVEDVALEGKAVKAVVSDAKVAATEKAPMVEYILINM